MLTRWILDPATGTSTEEQLDDRSMEFPRIREDLVGLPNSIGYAAGVGPRFQQDTLFKIDLGRRMIDMRTDSRYGYGEPVFIPRNDSAVTPDNEDDGYVMAFRHDSETNLSDLAIFDARGFTDDPVAVIHLPVRVPNGFHGNWCPA